MAEMSNAQLSAACEQLSSNADELRTQLSEHMPVVKKHSKGTRQELDDTVAALRLEVAPVVAAQPEMRDVIVQFTLELNKTKDLLKEHANPLIDKFPAMETSVTETQQRLQQLQ